FLLYLEERERGVALLAGGVLAELHDLVRVFETEPHRLLQKLAGNPPPLRGLGGVAQVLALREVALAVGDGAARLREHGVELLDQVSPRRLLAERAHLLGPEPEAPPGLPPLLEQLGAADLLLGLARGQRRPGLGGRARITTGCLQLLGDGIR